MSYNFYSYKGQAEKCLKMAQKGIPIAVIDLETTGRSATNNYIFEFAGVKLTFDDKLNPVFKEKLAVLMKPAEPLSAKITEITGFTNKDVEGRPTEKEVFSKIKAFMDNSIMCSHNTTFEYGFMSAMYERNGFIFHPVDIIDTLKMSRDLHKEEKSHKLSDIADRYGISKGVRFHDARDDTIVCFKLLSRFFNEYNDISLPEQKGKPSPKVLSIQYWEGKRHDQKRLYINTDYGTVWWSVLNRAWGEKDKGVLDAVNMDYLVTKVLSVTKCKSIDELSKFRGHIKCA